MINIFWLDLLILQETSEKTRPNQFVNGNIWDELVATCIEAGVIVPILSKAFYNRWHHFIPHQLQNEK